MQAYGSTPSCWNESSSLLLGRRAEAVQDEDAGMSKEVECR